MKMKLKKKMPISLNDQVKHPDLMWPTPSKGMWKQDVNDDGRYARDIKKKGFQVMLPAAVKIRGKGGGQLSPTWVEWIMGYPRGWTDLNV